MMNPYAQTLLDPFNVHGVQIPDDALYPSVPFTIVDRRTLSANASGIGGLCYGFWSTLGQVSAGSLIPIPTPDIDTGGQSYFAGMIFGSAATLANLTEGIHGTTGVHGIELQQWKSTNVMVPDTFDKVRLVSAGLNVQCTSNFSSNQGKYTAGFAPRNYSRTAGGQPFPVSYIQNLPDSVTIPISLEKGVTVTYSPVDEYSFRYAQIGVNQTPTGAPFAPNPLASAADWETQAQYSPGELWCAIDGAAANATFLVTCVLNYEGIVSNNNLLLASSMHSKQDPIAMTHALRVRESVPKALASSAMANGIAFNGPPSGLTTNTASRTQPQMFDSILNTLAKAPQAIEQAGSFMDKISPMLEEGLESLGALAL
jgi:hypothetical protein